MEVFKNSRPKQFAKVRAEKKSKKGSIGSDRDYSVTSNDWILTKFYQRYMIMIEKNEKSHHILCGGQSIGHR